ncbi:MAG: glutamate synthase central domain-containing protein, partial [Halodesulfurarchaeum sp.]
MCGYGDENCSNLVNLNNNRDNCGVGAVMDLDGTRSHEVLSEGLTILENLEHRGTTGTESNTGDGAGVLVQTPHELFESEMGDLPDQYAVGVVFLPREESERTALRQRIDSTLSAYELSVVDWRHVPTDNGELGKTALESEPSVFQCFVTPTTDVEPDEFDRQLYVARRALEHAIDHERFYVVSLDRRTIVYKGLLKGSQLRTYYPDLRDDRVRTNFALVHARFSTNTLGAWHLAHPYRNIVHNGEINTIEGNVNWMRARETDLSAPEFSEADMETILPVIADPRQSDTASLDNALDLLLQAGRDLPHALRMIIPEAWQGDDEMADSRREWYDFHASLLEPWDGPALVVATDGERIGAVLDRNGLRPCRYEITEDDRLVMSSEQGAIQRDPAEVVRRGRLEPGQLFVADPAAGRVIPDDEVFDELVDDRYGEWVERNQRRPGTVGPLIDETDRPEGLLSTYGYTRDDFDELLEPMAQDGTDPVGSMGDDTPLAVLSEFNKPLFDYFRQRFAQVTNPPIDYIREELVTSLETRLGRQRNLLGESPEHARQIVLESPIISDAELRGLRDVDVANHEIDITFHWRGALGGAIERIQDEAVESVHDGAEILVLSDRASGPKRLPIPSLLATSAIHHHLVREGLRSRVGLVVESGEPRTTHHVATLVGYGAGAVNPYLGIQTVVDHLGNMDDWGVETVVDRYVDALENGLLKIMAKMGISTVESYRGAQIFEIVGLDSDLVDDYFEGTTNRTGGIGLATIETELRERHELGFHDGDAELERQGEFQNLTNGRHHAWNPSTVQTLQAAVRGSDYDTFREFADLVEERNSEIFALRGLLDFRTEERDSIPL